MSGGNVSGGIWAELTQAGDLICLHILLLLCVTCSQDII